MKGIIEQFGGSWNGYTWIDQTTYLETATRDALDRMLFIEAERMARCLYHPDDCESERTVIISELQGGENDPDQLLDQELTATAFKAHPYRHPTIGWLSDLQTMTRDDLYGYYRRYYIPNNATLVIVGDVDTDDALRRVEQHFGSIPAGPVPERHWTVEPEQTGERRVTIRREGTAAYLKVALPRAGGRRRRLLSGARARRGADRREGRQPVVEFPRAAAAAPGAALSRARRARARVDGRLVSSLPTAEPFLYTVSATATDGTSLGCGGVGAAGGARRRARERHHGRRSWRARRAQLHARFVFDNDSVTNIAHQLGYFETIAGVDVFAVARRARAGRHARSGRRSGAGRC